MKRCPQCGETKPLDYEHWAPFKRDLETGEIIAFDGWCRVCVNRKNRERYARLTEEQREARRAYQREMRRLNSKDPAWRAKEVAQKRARRADPEVVAKRRAAQKRYRDKRNADPKRHAEYLANRRIVEKLRRERRTGKLDYGRRPTARAKEAWRATATRKPLEPFTLWINEVLATGAEVEELAERLGIPERRFYGYREREFSSIALPVAEKALLRYGPVRIHPQRVAEELARLEDYWRSAPGNGTRLTGYLAAAEPLVPLAGAVIVTTEDLWPDE